MNTTNTMNTMNTITKDIKDIKYISFNKKIIQYNISENETILVWFEKNINSYLNQDLYQDLHQDLENNIILINCYCNIRYLLLL